MAGQSHTGPASRPSRRSTSTGCIEDVALRHATQDGPMSGPGGELGDQVAARRSDFRGNSTEDHRTTSVNAAEARPATLPDRAEGRIASPTQAQVSRLDAAQDLPHRARADDKTPPAVCMCIRHQYGQGLPCAARGKCVHAAGPGALRCWPGCQVLHPLRRKALPTHPPSRAWQLPPRTVCGWSASPSKGAAPLT